jgi:serine/threonine-protein kinase RIO1
MIINVIIIAVDMSAFNGLFGSTAMKSFPSGHKANAQALQIMGTLSEANIHYAEFLKLQESAMTSFKTFYTRFADLSKKFKKRDEARQTRQTQERQILKRVHL